MARWIISLCIALFVAVPTTFADDKPDLPPLPSSLPLLDYQAKLYPFIAERRFAELGWRPDKAWRDTGPFVFGTSYGIHPAVRIYYSPEVLAWLKAGRKGSIPDGAIVVKEMAHPPAARFNEYRDVLEAKYPDDPDKVEAEMLAFLKGKHGGLNWTVMVKDSSVSHGGWFFAFVGQDGKVDSFQPPFSPASGGAGDGMCMRCHASADAELIFSDLGNVKGEKGQPLTFRVDESWRNMADFPVGPFNLPKWQLPAQGQSEQDLVNDYFHNQAALRTLNAAVTDSPEDVNPLFRETFSPKGIAVPLAQVQTLPSEWLDHVPSRPGGPQQFLTSDNCLGCHGGLGGPPSGTTMYLQNGPKYGDGFNISEYGEWRWSPMGLAGRDPIFYAQLESEFAMLEAEGNGDVTAALGTTCLSCHGAMGQRQLEIDAHARPEKGLEPNNFKVDYTLLHAPLTEAEKAKQIANGTFDYHQYGNLARDGISCAVCHHIAPPERAEGQPDYNKLDTYLMNSTTGVFRYTPPDQLIGPFPDVAQKPMEQAMGIRPVHDDYIKESEMCGACHTINLGNVGWPTDKPLPGYQPQDQAVFNQAAANGAAYLRGEYGVTFPEKLVPLQHSVEQATYIEWVNSSYSNPDTAQSCQDCHMKNSFESRDGTVKVDAITTQIASIQDTNLPDVENRLPDEDITIPFREGYKRHNFVGLNAFMVEMMRQFRNQMGLSRTDPMTYATNGAQLSIDTMALQARDEVADVSVSVETSERGLTALVGVTNKTGHRMPSGVGFRRAFLEVKAVGADGTQLWCSGCSNDVGVILGPDKDPLKTEFLDYVPEGATEALYQPHHDVIDDQTQVQIYEELTQDADKTFTTSFIRRIFHPKDNRLIPNGWLAPGTKAFRAKFGSSEVTAAFMKATRPEGRAEEDPDFRPGSDTTEYRITLPYGVDPAQVTVTATLMYQAIPPYYLKQRFETAPDGPATQRLYYLASRLQTKGRLIEGWKIRVQSASGKAG